MQAATYIISVHVSNIGGGCLEKLPKVFLMIFSKGRNPFQIYGSLQVGPGWAGPTASGRVRGIFISSAEARPGL